MLFLGLTIANIIPIMMLGRKQSLKGEPVLADYGPEESLNESADIEWVNKVSDHRQRPNGKCELQIPKMPFPFLRSFLNTTLRDFSCG